MTDEEIKKAKEEEKKLLEQAVKNGEAFQRKANVRDMMENGWEFVSDSDAEEIAKEKEKRKKKRKKKG